MMKKNQILGTISKNNWTILVVDLNGKVVDAVGVSNPPGFNFLKTLTRKHKGKILRFVKRKKLTEPQLEKIITEMTKDLKWAKKHELRAGCNFPP